MTTQTGSISDYVINHTERGECNCGRCVDKGNKPDPLGHTADLIFIKVAAIHNPLLDEFRKLSDAHEGVFASVNPFDGKEHGYIELGAWIGSQAVALQYMGLGVLLGAFELLTPRTVLAGLDLTDEMVMSMAGQGYVTIKAK